MARIITENDRYPDTRWNRTIRAEERVQWLLEMRNLPGYGQVAFFKGRHVIGRDRQIVEGVYLGAYAREAIVVSERDGRLEEVYRTMRRLLGTFPSRLDEAVIIRVVHEYVRELLPGGAGATEAIVRKHIGRNDEDRKIDLTLFIEGRAGVCRHRALLGGYLVEKLIRDKILVGSCSIDRNETDEGGHAWVRFTSKQTARILISDAGLDECGDIFKVEPKWGYRRPEDNAPVDGPIPSLVKKSPLFDELDAAVAAVSLLWAVWHFGLSRLF